MNNRQADRESLIEGIIAQITREIDAVVVEAEVSDDTREKIKNDLVANTERILDACSLDELQSEWALNNYIRSCVRDVEIQVRQLRRERTP